MGRLKERRQASRTQPGGPWAALFFRPVCRSQKAGGFVGFRTPQLRPPDGAGGGTSPGASSGRGWSLAGAVAPAGGARGCLDFPE